MPSRSQSSPPAIGRSAWQKARARGLTLIEITIALAIVAVVFSAALISIGSLAGTQAKAATAELSAVIRALYDTSALSGRTCRLVFEMPGDKSDEGETKYWAECAKGALTTSRDREELLREVNRAKDRKDELSGSGSYRAHSELEQLAAAERDRIESEAKYASFDTPEIEPKSFPASVRVGVWTKHQRTQATEGLAFLYFFPQGFTEKAMVFVRQGDNAWTITLSPLTGKTAVVGEELEVPRS